MKSLFWEFEIFLRLCCNFEVFLQNDFTKFYHIVLFAFFEFQKVAELSQHDPSLPFVRLNVGGSLFTPLRDTLKASTFFEDLLAEVERGRIKLPTDPRYAALRQGVLKRPRRNIK